MSAAASIHSTAVGQVLVTIDISRFLVQEGECWVWRARAKGKDYAQIRFADKYLTVTRLVYQHLHGPIPEDMLVCHRCDNPPCCRPDHLFLGTQSENIKDAFQKGRKVSPGKGLTQAGTANRKCRLTEDQVRLIRALSAQGESNSAIARKFGVANQTVSDIVSGQTWTHI